MKRISFILLLTVCVSLAFSQNLLFDIINGGFRAKTFAPRSMLNGEHYTLLADGAAVVKYDYKSGAAVDTVFNVVKFKNLNIKHIEDYKFSPNEKKMLIFTNSVHRYRRSFVADYYVYDVVREELTPLSENGAQETPQFSPDSRYIAFARENNLFLKKLDFNTEITITKDGERGKIINGVPDWVYEEEFSTNCYFEWSPDSKLLAFLRFEETQVPEFSFQIFNSPAENGEELSLYPTLTSFKYPKAGQKNSKVSVCVYDDFYKQIKTMKLGDPKETDFYVPRIKWTASSDALAIFQLNRNQNRLDMYLANPKSTLSKLVLRQEDKAYIDFENIDYTHFTADNQYFIAVTESNAFRHAYRYFINGTLDKQLTSGTWDITNVYGYDEAKKILYYQSAERSPLQRDIFAVDFKGKKTQLTDVAGIHNAVFNSTFTMFVDNFSALEKPNVLILKTVAGKTVRTLEDNADLAKKFADLNLPKKEFFTFKTAENVSLNAWLLKPKNLENGKKYPVLLVQYSGPNSQEVLDRWDIDWVYYLVNQGIIVACVDGRGTGARGVEFRKCTYQQLGELETRDQIELAKYLGNQSFIDKDRIGIWGWSYGGFMVLNVMSSGASVFKAGIAVAPVTDWRFYNTAYTERFMRRPQENFRGYEQNSPLAKATDLQGRLLIIHGSADDNVHLQNTMQYVEALVAADKQFEMQIYSDKNHSILGQQTRRHLYTRMTEFLQKNL